VACTGTVLLHTFVFIRNADLREAHISGLCLELIELVRILIKKITIHIISPRKPKSQNGLTVANCEQELTVFGNRSEEETDDKMTSISFTWAAAL
jgi:hypothetical protein